MKNVLFVLIALSILLLPAFAAVPGHTLKVYVKSDFGDPLNQALVKLSSRYVGTIDQDSGAIAKPVPATTEGTKYTDISGYATFTGLNFTDRIYSLAVSKSGYESKTLKDISVPISTSNPPLPTNIVVELKTLLPAGQKQYRSYLNSSAGSVEFDHKSLTNANLPYLINANVSEKVNNSSFTSNVKEKIGVTVDSKFETISTVKDLIATINSGDFNYSVEINPGIKLDQKNYSYFSDRGAQDDVKLPFFGQWYTVSKIDLNSAVKNVTMNLTSAMTTLYPGNSVPGLSGDGIYAGRAVSLKLVSVIQSGGKNYAKFELYDSNGTLIDMQTVQGGGTNLRTVFTNGEGQFGYSLATDIYVNNVYTVSGGYAELSTAIIMLYSGNTLTDLVGDGMYSGKPVSVKLASVLQFGGKNYAKFELYDSNGTLIDMQTVQGGGTNLRQVFMNGGSAQGYALATDLYVNNVYLSAGDYVELSRGAGSVLLYDGKDYPYDQNNNTGIYNYTVSLRSSGLGTPNAKFTGFTIRNSRERWDTSGVGNGPLYASGYSNLSGNPATTASFGNALPEGTVGKNFAKVAFKGFEDVYNRAIIHIGQNPVPDSATVTMDMRAAYGGTLFLDSTNTIHGIPFALKLSNTGASTYDSFSFDGQTIAYTVITTPADTTTTLYANSCSNPYYLNGHKVYLSRDSNAGPPVYNRIVMDFDSSCLNGKNYTVTTGSQIAIDNVTYSIVNSQSGMITFRTDGYALFRKMTSTGTIISGGQNDTNTLSPTYGKWYFTRNQVNNSSDVQYDEHSRPYNIRLLGNNGVEFRFAQLSNSNYYWLVLPAYALSSMQFGNSLKFLGTASTTTETESATVNKDYYLPDSSDWNAAYYAGDSKHQIAVFLIDRNVSTGSPDLEYYRVYLNTENGGLFAFPDTNLSAYSWNVGEYSAISQPEGSPTWYLTNGAQSNFLSAGWSDIGTKAWLDVNKGNVNFSIQQFRPKVIVDVIGAAVVTPPKVVEPPPIVQEATAPSGTSGTTKTQKTTSQPVSTNSIIKKVLSVLTGNVVLGAPQLVNEGGKNEYKITGKKSGRLFSIFPSDYEVTVHVDAKSGQVTKVDSPWWAPMVSG